MTSDVFTQTTHVVAAPHGLARVVIYSEFHKICSGGFWAEDGRILAIPITLTTGFCNSMNYRTSCDGARSALFLCTTQFPWKMQMKNGYSLY